jgi:DNA-binding beta-propeller fold protein YncE
VADTAAQATPIPADAQDLVAMVVWDPALPKVVTVDTTTGTSTSIRVKLNGGYVTGAIVTDRGGIVVGAFDAEANATTLQGYAPGSAQAVMLGKLDGSFFLQAIDGQAALLVQFEDGLPFVGEIIELPIEWSVGTARANPGRIAAIVPDIDAKKLVFAAFDEQGQFGVRRTQIDVSPYISVQMLRGTTKVIVTDFFAQSIRIVDLTTEEVLMSTIFGLEQFKRPRCAADLSPDQSTLYVLANINNGGDGILVFDTATLTQLVHLRPHDGTTSCLRVAPSGDRLVLIQRDKTVIIDAPVISPETEVVSGASGCCGQLTTTFLP